LLCRETAGRIGIELRLGVGEGALRALCLDVTELPLQALLRQRLLDRLS
jgi:hypothetical protein